MTLHTYTPTNVPTSYQLTTSYSFQDISQTRQGPYGKVKAQIKVTPLCCQRTPQAISPPSMKLLYLMVLRYSPDTKFIFKLVESPPKEYQVVLWGLEFLPDLSFFHKTNGHT